MKRYTILKQGNLQDSFLLETAEGSTESKVVAEGKTTRIQALAETLNAAEEAKALAQVETS